MSSPRVTAGSVPTLLAVLLLLLAVGVAIAQAPEFGLKQTILNPAPSPNAQFGYAVAVAGGNVLVGAPFDDEAGTDTGAVYLFDATTGKLLQTFRSPQPAPGDWFGISVAAAGATVLVGALGDDTGAHDAGAAYLFDAATGNLLRTFQKPTPAEADWFGGAVAAVGGNVLVGAPLDDLGGTDAGAAYLFDATSGALVHTFANPTPGRDDWFGVALAATADRIAIGAMQDDAAGRDAGAVHLFDAGTSALLKSVPNPGQGTGDWFGVALAAYGSHFLAGAPLRDAGARDAGEVFLIHGGVGEVLRVFPNPAPEVGAGFGRALAAVGEIFLVGAPGPTEDGRGGSVWLMPGEGAPTRLPRQGTRTADGFGFALAAAGRLLVVGSPLDDTGEPDSGAAYLFTAP